MMWQGVTCDRCGAVGHTSATSTPVGLAGDPQTLDTFCQGGEMAAAGWVHRVTYGADDVPAAEILCPECVAGGGAATR